MMSKLKYLFLAFFGSAILFCANQCLANDSNYTLETKTQECDEYYHVIYEPETAVCLTQNSFTPSTSLRLNKKGKRTGYNNRYHSGISSSGRLSYYITNLTSVHRLIASDSILAEPGHKLISLGKLII